MDAFNQNLRMKIGSLVVDGMLAEAQRDLIAGELATAQEELAKFKPNGPAGALAEKK